MDAGRWLQTLLSPHPAGMNIVLTGAGLGGHYQAAMALAEALLRLEPSLSVSFIGTAPRPGEPAVLESRIPHLLLPTRGGPLRHLHGIRDGSSALEDLGAEAVISTGGVTALHVGIPAIRRRLPLFLQEQNALPGRANRLLLPFARHLYTGLPDTRVPRLFRRRTQLLGTPVRIQNRPALPEDYERFRLSGRRPVLLVWGGSQGARSLNLAVEEMLKDLPDNPVFDLLWVTGPRHTSPDRDLEDGTAVRTHRVLNRDEVQAALRITTAAISRAGGVAVSELLASRIPSVLVPYPHARDDHQRENARVLAKRGMVRVLDPDALSADALRNLALPLLEPSVGREGVVRKIEEVEDEAPAADRVARDILESLS